MYLNLNQELQNKYPHLEISVLKMSQAKSNKDFRIDSEYFSKKYIEIDKLLSNINAVRLDTLTSKISDGTHFTPNYKESGVKFISAINISDNYFDLDAGYKYISKEEHKKLYSRCNPEYNDVLIRKVGAGLRKSCVIPKIDEQFSIFVSVALIKCNSINPFYLSTFLNSTYGQTQLLRFNKGIGQPDLHLEDIARCLIPIFPLEFQQQIEQMVRESHECLEQSKALYREAEVLLYRELGLDPENPLASIEPHSGSLNISVRTLKESFLATGRLDSEYYQQKYDKIERIIAKFETIKLGDLVDYPISSGATPKSGGEAYTESENGILFLRAVDLKNGEVDLNNAIKIKPEIHSGLLKRTKILTGDILFSIAGTIGRTAIYTHQENANINQALSIIRFSENKGIKKLYFIAFFNSVVGQMYLEKYARQGLQTNLNLNEVSNLIIPKISIETQTQIAEKIKQSFTLRKKASELLQTAKQSVETAIEKG